MRIYHFCAERHVKHILRQGVTIGSVTEFTPKGYIMHSGYMWLTLDPDPKRQSWNVRHRIHYTRTAWRLTIEIPPEECGRIYDRERLVKLFPLSGQLFDGWPGSENWRVFKGMIPKEWIVEAERMEG